MSDLSATNCGCGCERNERSGFGNNSCLWIILLLFCCGGCGNGFSGNNNGCGASCIWIILLLFCCGGFGIQQRLWLWQWIRRWLLLILPKNSGWFKPGRNFIFSSPYFCPCLFSQFFFLLFLLHISNPVHKLHFHL